MRCVLLRGACLQHARPVGHFDGFLVDIKVAASSHAINLSEALKRPERSFGGTTDSKASSFTAGSTRVYISVVCVFAWPSHSATFRRSFVTCRKVKAQMGLRTCGCTRFVVSEGKCCFAVRTCLRRMYSQPERDLESLKLSNAFTSAKELDPILQFKATAKLGGLLEVRFCGSF